MAQGFHSPPHASLQDEIQSPLGYCAQLPLSFRRWSRTLEHQVKTPSNQSLFFRRRLNTSSWFQIRLLEDIVQCANSHFIARFARHGHESRYCRVVCIGDGFLWFVPNTNRPFRLTSRCREPSLGND